MTKVDIKEMLPQHAGKATSMIARELGVTELEVVRALSPVAATEVAPAAFDAIMAEVPGWGPITFLVQNESVILEVKGELPTGSHGQGFYNLKHGASPIGGHIRAGDVRAVFFVTQPFMGMESVSIQFYNGQGNAMCKLFLSRTDDRTIRPDQRLAYEALRKRLQQEYPVN